MTPSLCLEMLFTDRPFVERMEAAARIGYRAIEFWDWRDKNLGDIRRAAGDLGLRVSAFSGNRRYALTRSSQRGALLDELRKSLEAAARLDCHHLMLLADCLGADGRAVSGPEEIPAAARLTSLGDSLAAAAEVVRGAGATLLLEPLNTKLDHPGYCLDRSEVAFDVVRRLDSPRVRVLYDCYHMAMMGEDVVAALETGVEWVGYVHVADMPGRHEPGTGRIDYRAIRTTLERLHYAGAVGMEFSPSESSEAAARRALELFATPVGRRSGR